MKPYSKALFSIGLASWAAPDLAYSKTFAEQCPDIPTCAKTVSELLGHQYLYNGDLKGTPKGTPNLELTKENAELIFTQVLDQEGYARVPVEPKTQPGLYQLMRQRDARDSALPQFQADKKNPAPLPGTWDLVTLRYKASNPEAVEFMARNSRSFMPANSRIIPDKLSGSLWITDSAINISKIYAMIREQDQPLTPEQKRELKEAQEKRKKEAAEKHSPAAPDRNKKEGNG